MRWRLPRGAARPAGSGGAVGQWPRRIPSPPATDYRPLLRVPIRDGVGQATVSAQGTATVQVGPVGLGSKWYPVQAVIATTSGANDASTCQLFAGPLAIHDTQTGGQSYAGGGDTIGLAGVMLQPGEFIFAVWSGGKSGDTATLRIIGDQIAATA